MLAADLTQLLKREKSFYYIHLEIAGDPCNLIGSQQSDSSVNRTILCSNPANEEGTLKQTTNQISRFV